jgi:membrane-bound ClpP family serine protease
MKSYHKYLLIALAFVAIGFGFRHTIYAKNLFFGLALLFLGIWIHADNRKNPPERKGNRIMHLRSYYAWIFFIVIGFLLIVVNLYYITTFGVL